MTRAQLFWRRTVSKKFASRSDRTQPPVIAPAPAPSLPGTFCGPSLAAQIVVDKFCDHLPHCRQSTRLFRLHGVHIGRQTLNAWSHALPSVATLGTRPEMNSPIMPRTFAAA